jgi:hypothetical protein
VLTPLLMVMMMMVAGGFFALSSATDNVRDRRAPMSGGSETSP